MAIIITLFLSLYYLYLISIFIFPVAACNQRPSKALGQARLSIVKLFKSLIDTNTYTINATLAQIRTLEVLMVGWIHYFILFLHLGAGVCHHGLCHGHVQSVLPLYHYRNFFSNILITTFYILKWNSA